MTKKEIKQERKLQRLKRENPKMCFCDDSVHNFNIDTTVGYTSEWLHPIYGNLGKQPLKRCSVCGKIYYTGVVMA